MKHYQVFKNGEGYADYFGHDNQTEAFVEWLDSNGLEFEDIVLNSDGNCITEIDGDLFEIRG